MNKRKLHIFIDFDKTLAYHESDQPLYILGKPIPEMVAKVKGWVDKGHKYSIFTARMNSLTHDKYETDFQYGLISNWIKENNLPTPVHITAIKSAEADFFVDDKAVGVKRNTGYIENLPEELQ